RSRRAPPGPRGPASGAGGGGGGRGGGGGAARDLDPEQHLEGDAEGQQGPGHAAQGHHDLPPERRSERLREQRPVQAQGVEGQQREVQRGHVGPDQDQRERRRRRQREG